jgi:hypothetical protein
MGDKPANNSIVSRLYQQLTLFVSSALEASGAEALGDVLGLLVRRQAAIWADWRLWLAFATLVLPFSFLLAMLAQTVRGESAVYTWMYAKNWEWALTQNVGFLVHLCRTGS